jgi:hypothetical protein
MPNPEPGFEAVRSLLQYGQTVPFAWHFILFIIHCKQHKHCVPFFFLTKVPDFQLPRNSELQLIEGIRCCTTEPDRACTLHG